MKKRMIQLFSVLDGRLSTTGMDDVYDFFNHITGDSLMTHHLPVANDFLKKVNPKWYQDLKAKLQKVKDEHGNDFNTLMKVLEKDTTEYEVPTLTTEELKGFGEFMVKNSLLLKKLKD